jgi:hypothetical protein
MMKRFSETLAMRQDAASTWHCYFWEFPDFFTIFIVKIIDITYNPIGEYRAFPCTAVKPFRGNDLGNDMREVALYEKRA